MKEEDVVPVRIQIQYIDWVALRAFNQRDPQNPENKFSEFVGFLGVGCWGQLAQINHIYQQKQYNHNQLQI